MSDEAPSDPAPSDPAPSDPALTEPAPSEEAPSEKAPSEKGQAAPKHGPRIEYPWFDWVRFVSAILVSFAHDNVMPGAWGNPPLQIFFAMSGWLIGGMLLETKPEKLTRFYYNRSIRIWIPYYTAAALLVAGSLIRDPIDWKWAEFVFYKLTYVYNIFGPPQLAQFQDAMPLDGSGNHFWSLCLEEQFYLFSPFILVVLPRWFGRSRITWLVIAALTVYFNLYGAISLGVLAAVLKHHIGPFHRLLSVRVGAAAIATGLGVLMAYEILPYDTFAPFFAIGFTIASAKEGPRSKLGAWLGGWTYPFYLNHWFGLYISNGLFKMIGMRDSWIDKTFALTLASAVGAILYMAIDLQIGKRREKWYTPERARWATFTGFALVAIGLAGGVLIKLFGPS